MEGKFIIMASPLYQHNSPQKDIVRQKWVEFASQYFEENSGLSLITFPSEEFHELSVYKESGLIDWEEMETGGYKITKGKVVCFEKEGNKFRTISKMLINATVELGEFGSVLRSKYQAIMNRSVPIFPVDMINLDYDGCISKIKVPITETVERIFQFQALHEKSFSFFMTWPHTEEDDSDNYKRQLKTIIRNNLTDPNAVDFKNSFDEEFKSVNDLDYEQLSIIGMVKFILRNSSNRLYKLATSEFIAYGGVKNRKRMFSILMNFDFVGDELSPHEIYSQDVSSALNAIKDLNG
jgi:hypothetical protein